jgi:predicted transcriptional regulator
MNKFQQLFNLLDTHKTIGELQADLGWSKSMITFYTRKLHVLGLIKKTVSSKNGCPFIFIRDAEELTEAQLLVLQNRKNVETQSMRVTRDQVTEMHNEYLFGTKPVPVHNAIIVPLENKYYSRLQIETIKQNRPKSPKNYAGTSAGMVW